MDNFRGVILLQQLRNLNNNPAAVRVHWRMRNGPGSSVECEGETEGKGRVDEDLGGWVKGRLGGESSLRHLACSV